MRRSWVAFSPAHLPFASSQQGAPAIFIPLQEKLEPGFWASSGKVASWGPSHRWHQLVLMEAHPEPSQGPERPSLGVTVSVRSLGVSPIPSQVSLFVFLSCPGHQQTSGGLCSTDMFQGPQGDCGSQPLSRCSLQAAACLQPTSPGSQPR